MKFKCIFCKQYRSEDEISSTKSYPARKGRVCKCCHNERARIYTRGLKAKSNPTNYLECDSCDSILNKYKLGRPRKDGVRLVNTECRYCGSAELIEYFGGGDE